jgi:hypothetical protein
VTGLGELGAHHERMRLRYPADELCVVFDVDGTILDPRSRVALSVVRWFTLLPHTHVAVNTGRPDRLRAATLESLNAAGRTHRVVFDPALLCMNSGDGDRDVRSAKSDGVRRLQSEGLRVVAVVDSDPANIRAMAARDESGEILFLHTDTAFGSAPDLAGLVSEGELASRVEFVWHGVNDPQNLREFLASTVRWAEVDVRRDPLDRIVLRHDSFDTTPRRRAERPFLLDQCLHEVRAAGRAAKLDFKESGDVLARTLAVADRLGFDDTSLWFNSNADCLGQDGFRQLRERYPAATITCPVDFIAPLVLSAPAAADAALAVLGGCGVNRLSLAWTTSRFHELLERLESRGWDVNVYAVPDLAAFLEAALLIPRSLTADFNFPEWGYHGRGSGERKTAAHAAG